jgi:hypothetical protein
MRAFSIFVNAESDSIAINFSEEFLNFSDKAKLDILCDAISQLQCVQARVCKRVEVINDNE